ncbi:MAG: nucleoside triphosphate pyrophosphohydrolase [Fusobacteriaceae bacterium]
MKEFDNLVKIMKELRGENGCPWDQKQTLTTLKEYLLEETYETLEVMDEGGDKLKGELGDLLLNIVFQSQICEEKKEFNIKNVIENLTDKLIRRHPHIFLDKREELSAEEVKIQWDKVKKGEKEHENRKSILDGIPKTFPPMMRAEKIIKKVSEVGFDWEDANGVLDKIQEEIEELRKELENGKDILIKNELGDLIFSLINLSRYLGYNSSDVLENTNKKFERRFRYVENNCEIKKENRIKMEKKWQEAKKIVG